VAGFVIVVAPSGLGVREFFLTLFLAPELAALAGLGEAAAQATAVLTVLVLRLVWTAAELVAAAILSSVARRHIEADQLSPLTTGRPT
jgi:uncharacterized membrane protein YbhN (UPF0104 family)